MTSQADLDQARAIIVGLVDAANGACSEHRAELLLHAAETEARLRRPGWCDEPYKRAVRSYIAGLIEAGDLATIRERYSRPAAVEPRPGEPAPDSVTINPGPRKRTSKATSKARTMLRTHAVVIAVTMAIVLVSVWFGLGLLVGLTLGAIAR